MKADDFYDRQGKRYPTDQWPRSYTSIKALEFLVGRAWDDIALAYVHALRPSMIRVVRAEETTDAQPWRVTVYVDEKDIITGIRQEVEVWLPQGVEDGHALSTRINFRDDE